MGIIDYEEGVELWTLGQRSDALRTATDRSGIPVAKLPLWKAVRIVIADWELGSFRQRSAQIVRKRGASLMDLRAIQAIYDQDDFPARRERRRHR